MSDVAVAQRRALIKRKKRERMEAQPPGMQGLSQEQRLIIEELMDAQMKTFDSTFSHFKNFRVGGLQTGLRIPQNPRACTDVVSGSSVAQGLLEMQIPVNSVLLNFKLWGGQASPLHPPPLAWAHV